MDGILQFLHDIIIYLHIITVIVIIAKAILVFRNKGFNIPAVITSFFRVYSKSDLYMTNNETRQQYMKMNNLINYYIYIWVLATVIVFVVFQSLY